MKIKKQLYFFSYFLCLFPVLILEVMKLKRRKVSSDT